VKFTQDYLLLLLSLQTICFLLCFGCLSIPFS